MSERIGNAPRVIRTLGYAKAHDPDNIFGTADLGLDAVGPDLEDLTPRADKPRAREMFREIAKELHGRGVNVQARINTLEGGAEADLEAIVCAELHCVNLSKAESAEEVQAVARILDRVEEENGLPNGHTWIRPVVETARGVRFAYEIAAASPRVMYMGGVAGGFWGDLGNTLGCITGPDGNESYYIRSKVLVDVRAAGSRFPIGGGQTSRADLDGVREFAWQNKRLGYTGQYTSLGYYAKDRGLAKQMIDTIHAVYTPTPAELELWGELAPVLQAGHANGDILPLFKGTHYDTAGLQRILDQLDLARRIGIWETP